MVYEDMMVMDRVIIDGEEIKNNDDIKNIESITSKEVLEKMVYAVDYRILNNFVCEFEFRYKGVKNTDYAVFNYISDDLFTFNIFRKSISGFNACYDITCGGFRGITYRTKNKNRDKLLDRVIEINKLHDFLLRECLLVFYEQFGLEESNAHIYIHTKKYLRDYIMKNTLLDIYSVKGDNKNIFKIITTYRCARYLYDNYDKFRIYVDDAVKAKAVLCVVILYVLNKKMIDNIVYEKNIMRNIKIRDNGLVSSARAKRGMKDVVIDGIRYVYKSKNLNKDIIKREYNRVARSWSVRGHMRKCKSGKVVFVKPHTKGKGRLVGKNYIIK